ncbi:MAG: chloride channel protein [Hungatella sp.]|nr:chloride channel protein [Hungatella sp.]
MERLKIKVPFGAQVDYFVKWTLISVVLGVCGGVVGGAFGHGIRLAAECFQNHSWLLYLLPVSGVIIVFLYRAAGQEKNKGTNMVLVAISSDEKMSLVTGPLIFAGTVLTHLTGGSAGREGAALQIGGSLGTLIGKVLRLDEKDGKVAVMCGMSACFGALFGTPLAAGIFSLEVVSIGIMYYAALVPCLFASFIGAGVSGTLGLSGEHFTIVQIPEFGVVPAIITVFLGSLCAVLSIGFCLLLHQAEHWYRHFFRNPYLRILAASVILILLTTALGSRIYNGSSVALIEEALEGRVRYEAFLLKMLFTAVTLGAGYKGGEIVPTLCVGAAFGCIVGTLLGFSPSLCAACGMAALFAGVTNCPISSLFIAFEMCGFEAMPYFAIAIAVSFTLSGYYGLYGSQKFVYSKVKTEFINRKANEYDE